MNRHSAISPLDALAAVSAEIAGSPTKVRVGGVVTEASATAYRISGLSQFLRLGDWVRFEAVGCVNQLGEAIKVDVSTAIVKPFQAHMQAGVGALAWRVGAFAINPDESWKGRVINALGEPIDAGGALQQGPRPFAADREPPLPLTRARVNTPVKTGVAAIDIFTPLCAGQRIGVFAGSGVGKSILLAMLARSQGFDTAVIALVGERGREVREFLEDTLGEARQRAVVVVATGDESAMMRRLALKTAMGIAEYFRDAGEKVLLIADSVTRFAHAAREVALAAGEPPVARGYPPSVFTDLPRILERAGPGGVGGGSITGVFSVLVDGDDHNDPIADAVRGVLDGHIILDRAIADQGRYPAINILSSISRLAEHAWSQDERKMALALRGMAARFEETRDLRLMGGYQTGSDAALDKAIEFTPKLYDALKQGPGDAAMLNPFQDVARVISQTHKSH
ncbi:MAG: flagellar protein export ATPase FliI [Hyphomicrobiales bacterium]|nr:flagellar protein export ATPase FliI [Hyphomicrobiales bacterium]